MEPEIGMGIGASKQRNVSLRSYLIELREVRVGSLEILREGKLGIRRITPDQIAKRCQPAHLLRARVEAEDLDAVERRVPGLESFGIGDERQLVLFTCLFEKSSRP